MIEARNVYKQYQMGRVTLEVLKGVSLRLDAGAFVAIMGPSGAGKSTLLHLVAALDAPTRGEVFWDGQPLSRISEAKRAAFRNRMIGIVFQFYHLMPELSALENVMLPGFVRGDARVRELRGRATACLDQVGLRGRLHHRPKALSGGEQQRVAIARALINEPKLLFCDEPTGNLDSTTGSQIAELLVTLQQRRHMSLVLVTHEAMLAGLADRALVLRDGRIVSDNRPQTTEIRRQAEV